MTAISQFNPLLWQLIIGLMILVRPVGSHIEENTNLAINIATEQLELPRLAPNFWDVDGLRQLRIDLLKEPTLREAKLLGLLPDPKYVLEMISANRAFAAQLKAVEELTYTPQVTEAIAENDSLYAQWLLIGTIQGPTYNYENEDGTISPSQYYQRQALMEYVAIVGEANYYGKAWPTPVPFNRVPYRWTP